MRTSLLLSFMLLSLFSCKEEKKNVNPELAQVAETPQEYTSFGEKISAENSLTAQEMKLRYEKLKPGDTISVKFTTTVNSVCKMKGCWMTLDIPGNEEDLMVKFKDYKFFVPKDIEGKEVVVAGIAFLEETSVKDQKHYAEDAGRSKEQIALITERKRSPGFLAHGVLLKK